MAIEVERLLLQTPNTITNTPLRSIMRKKKKEDAAASTFSFTPDTDTPAHDTPVKQVSFLSQPTLFVPASPPNMRTWVVGEISPSPSDYEIANADALTETALRAAELSPESDAYRREMTARRYWASVQQAPKSVPGRRAVAQGPSAPQRRAAAPAAAVPQQRVAAPEPAVPQRHDAAPEPVHQRRVVAPEPVPQHRAVAPEPPPPQRRAAAPAPGPQRHATAPIPRQPIPAPTLPIAAAGPGRHYTDIVPVSGPQPSQHRARSVASQLGSRSWRLLKKGLKAATGELKEAGSQVVIVSNERH